jgi:ribosomal protein S18 acetylase RimI-like enzyme
MIDIRKMRKSDVPRVVELWRRTRPHDHVDQRRLEAFLDSSAFYIPEAVLVAADGNEIIGSIVGTVRGKDEGRIPLFFVSTQHLKSLLADSLLHQALQVFTDAALSHAEAGTSWETELSDCGYDTRYTDIIGVLSRNGFRRVWSDEELDVDIMKDLRTFTAPQWVADARCSLEREMFSFVACNPSLRQRYLAFMLEHFRGYGGWCTRAKEYAKCHRESGFHMVALHTGNMVGFTECIHDADKRPACEWYIYATGVRSDLRKRKIGSVLLYASLAEIKQRGGDMVCIGEAPLDFYRVVEGTVVRRYMVMRKDLQTANNRLQATRTSRAPEP